MKNFSRRQIFIVIAITSLVLFLLAFYYYKSESGQIIKEKHEYLDAVINIKLDQVADWKKERLSSAQFLPTIGKFIKYTSNLNSNINDVEAKEYFSNVLLRSKENGYYENILITDINGQILFDLDTGYTTIGEERLKEIKSAVQKNGVVFGNFYNDPGFNKILFNIISIIKDNDGVPIGCLIQQVDPNKSLFTLIKKLPTLNKSIEILLFKRVNDKIVYLNELRHKKNSALSLKIPLSDTNVVSVKAVLGARGIIEGQDYRGADVLADVKTVPGTDWFMVTKMDKDELYSELYYRAGAISLVALFIILLTTLSALYIYKLQQNSIYKNLFLKEKELSETQEEYRTALYSIGDAVITTDTQGNIKQMNSVAETLTGWKEIEVKGKSLSEVFKVINEETNVAVENPVNHVLRNGAVVGLANHTMLISKKGNKIPIADSGSPIKNSDGKITGVVLVFRDQTEERIKEKVLQESNEKFSKIFKHSSDSISLTQLSTGKLFEINDGFVKMFGYTREEALGKTTFELGLWANQNDRIKMLEMIRLNGYVKNFEAVGIQKNGNLIIAIISGEFVDLNNEKFLLLSLKDITERKKTENDLKASEENYRLIFENNPHPMWVYDIETLAFLAVNNSAIAKYGYTKDEFLSMTIKQIRPQEDVDRLMENIKGVTEGIDEAGIWRHLKKDGTLIYVEIVSHTLDFEEHKAEMILASDVTEKIRAERELKESQERLSLALTSTKQGIYDLNVQTGEAKVTPEYATMLGYDPKSFKESNALWIERLHPDDREITAKAYSDYIDGKTSEYRVEFRQRTADNKWKWILSLGKLVEYDSNGNPLRMLGTHTDITQQKRVEERLRKLSRAVEQSPTTIMITDLNANIEYVNPKFTEVTGYTFDEVKGQNPHILSSGQKTQDDYGDMWNTILRGNEWRGEFFNKKKNGEPYWESAAISPITDVNGKITHFVALKEDITEKKKILEQLSESEEEFRSIWENSVDAMRLVDKNGVIINVNDSYCKLFGLKKEDLIGNVFNVSYVITETNTSLDGFKERFKNDTIIKKFETEIQLKSGKVIWVELTNSFIEFEDKATMLLSIIRDITDRKKIIADLIEAKAKAEEMNKVKTYFFANMSHELRTPFVGIMGFSELLVDILINPEEKKYAEQILKSSKRLTDTLNKILNVAKIEFDGIETSLSEMNLDGTVKEISDLYSQSAMVNNTELITDLKFGSSRIISDKKLLEEILDNLISNAVKYTKNGQVKVSSEKIQEDEKVYVILKIADTGVGIPEEMQNIVWQEFRQASEGFSRSFEGTGLGLTITKKYVEKLNGIISLESKEGKGTLFTIKLPVTFASNDKVKTEKSIKHTIKVDTNSNKPKYKVLYVEDDAIALQYITIVLKSSYDIETAFNAKIALDLVIKNQYDVLMVDINLGRGMDGVQLMQEIKKIEYYKNIPFVAITAYAAESDKAEFLAKGFSHYISKPFSSNDLKDLLSKIIKQFS